MEKHEKRCHSVGTGVYRVCHQQGVITHEASSAADSSAGRKVQPRSRGYHGAVSTRSWYEVSINDGGSDDSMARSGTFARHNSGQSTTCVHGGLDCPFWDPGNSYVGQRSAIYVREMAHSTWQVRNHGEQDYSVSPTGKWNRGEIPPSNKECTPMHNKVKQIVDTGIAVGLVRLEKRAKVRNVDVDSRNCIWNCVESSGVVLSRGTIAEAISSTTARSRSGERGGFLPGNSGLETIQDVPVRIESFEDSRFCVHQGR